MSGTVMRATYLSWAVLALAAGHDGCAPQPTVPMPARSDTADFAVVHRTAVDGFGEVYVLVHVPTGKCYVSIDPAGEGGGAITTTEQVVCMTYTKPEGTR